VDFEEFRARIHTYDEEESLARKLAREGFHAKIGD
jgi:hypothetical protein